MSEPWEYEHETAESVAYNLRSEIRERDEALRRMRDRMDELQHQLDSVFEEIDVQRGQPTVPVSLGGGAVEARGPCAVELRGPMESVIVLGQDVGVIRGSEYPVVKALWEAYQNWQAGKGARVLSGPAAFGGNDASSALTGKRGLCKRIPIFARVLICPGSKQKKGPEWRRGYWLLSVKEASAP